MRKRSKWLHTLVGSHKHGVSIVWHSSTVCVARCTIKIITLVGSLDGEREFQTIIACMRDDCLIRNHRDKDAAYHSFMWVAKGPFLPDTDHLETCLMEKWLVLRSRSPVSTAARIVQFALKSSYPGVRILHRIMPHLRSFICNRSHATPCTGHASAIQYYIEIPKDHVIFDHGTRY